MLYLLMFTSLMFINDHHEALLAPGEPQEMLYDKDRTSYQYSVPLKESEHVRILFDQVSCYLIVTARNPEGEKITERAATNFAGGPLMLNFQAKKAGIYQVQASLLQPYEKGRDLAKVTLLEILSHEDWLAQKKEQRILDVKNTATPIRSIDFADDDFSDLMPLKKAIGDARVVMLGEQTHSDGGTSEARARLTRFLRQEMNFNVLMFESGIYQVYQLQQDFLDQKTCTQWTDSLFWFWGRGSQNAPIRDMYENQNQPYKPMEICGFDSQLWGPYAEAYPETIKQFLLDNGGKVHDQHHIFTDVIFAISNLDYRRKRKPWPTKEFTDTFFSILDDYEKQLSQMKHKNDSLDLLFHRQTLASLRVDAPIYIISDYPRKSWRTGREMQMGQNALWLIQNIYPNERIILWGATSHFLRNKEQARDYFSETKSQERRVGDYIYDVIGDELYTIAFTAYEGSYGYEDKPTRLP